MKLSFSTLGCPDWQFDDIFSVAADLGYNGIEIRGIADEIYAPKIKVFQPENIEITKAKLKKANIELPILTPGAYITDNPNLHESELEIRDYIKLACKLECKYIRVMGERTPNPIANITSAAVDNTLKHFQTLCDFAQGYGTALLIETNGFFAKSEVLKDFLDRTERGNCGALWDVHHSVRYFDETPATTIKTLGAYIRHTHIKDSVKGRNGVITYMLTGYGDIPVEEAVYELNSAGYSGYYSYEWVKRWSRELAEPGVAFYQYLSYMRDLK